MNEWTEQVDEWVGQPVQWVILSKRNRSRLKKISPLNISTDMADVLVQYTDENMMHIHKHADIIVQRPYDGPSYRGALQNLKSCTCVSL